MTCISATKIQPIVWRRGEGVLGHIKIAENVSYNYALARCSGLKVGRVAYPRPKKVELESMEYGTGDRGV